MRQKVKVLRVSKGFTLIESVIGIAIFAMLAGVVYQSISVTLKEANSNLENTTVSFLASQYMETARNIPYAQIGTIQGNPHGNLPDLANPSNTLIGNTTYQAYFEITYVDDPADGIFPADPAPNDYKQVKLSIKNTTTNEISDFTTTIVPTGLENLTAGGALSLSVINAVGQPVPGATIEITNNSLSPSIDLTRTSDANGNWIEVGLPDSANSYHVVVTKAGYSSDQTYPITLQNPSPTKPDATIANGQITQISFSIDQTSNLTFNTLDQTCNAISGVGLEIKGAKIIGTPSVIKYDNTFTSDGNGQIALNNIEWDNYTPALTGNNYMIYGSSPIQQINLLPATTQLFNLILGSKTANSLLVIVKDSSTGNPIEGANVELTNTTPDVDSTLITGGSLWSQQFWNGGSGQADWLDHTMYWQDDGGISTNDVPPAMRLINSNGNTLVTSGYLESSAFDTGSDSAVYTTLSWLPASQGTSASAEFQVATSSTDDTNTNWNFIGPDGTSATYYTTPGTTINSLNNNKRYVKYKAYLSTTDTTQNPTITSVNVNYVSGCFTPGQVMFPDVVSAGPTYQVVVSMPGYTAKTISNLDITGYQTLQVLLTSS